jgi:protein-S-isoprenylcysteine O-methyltransferase Ste14
MRALIFKNRGLLLSLPALALVSRGKPSATSIAVGLPIAVAGELLRCWAVGYSGVTTRSDVVTAPKLVTAGPYAYIRNPLYAGNFITAAGFAIAFTGRNCPAVRALLVGGSLATMAAAYTAIVPHEESFLREEFGESFDRYCASVSRYVPRSTPYEAASGEWDGGVVRDAESKTFVTFAGMLVALAVRARRA